MQFLEKDLEEIIYEAGDEALQKQGLPMCGTRYRQLRIGNYGIADLVTVKRVENTLLIRVYELKKDKIDATAMMQAYRYCKGIKRYIKDFREKDIFLDFRVILVGKELCRGDFCYLSDFIWDLSVFTYSFKLDGLKFNLEQRYKLTEEGFYGKD